MRKQRWLLFPISFAWLVCTGWWFSRPEVCDRCQGVPMRPAQSGAPAPVSPDASAAVQIKGPSTFPVPETAPSKELKPPDPLILRFNKNTGNGELKGGMEDFAQQGSAYLATVADAEVLVIGHTDADGSQRTNEALSLARANIVRDRLVQLGLPSSRIRTVGVGAQEPVSDNVTSRGKALNRRVEIKIVPVIHRTTP